MQRANKTRYVTMLVHLFASDVNDDSHNCFTMIRIVPRKDADAKLAGVFESAKSLTGKVESCSGILQTSGSFYLEVQGTCPSGTTCMISHAGSPAAQVIGLFSLPEFVNGKFEPRRILVDEVKEEVGFFFRRCPRASADDPAREQDDSFHPFENLDTVNVESLCGSFGSMGEQGSRVLLAKIRECESGDGRQHPIIPVVTEFGSSFHINTIVGKVEIRKSKTDSSDVNMYFKGVKNVEILDKCITKITGVPLCCLREKTMHMAVLSSCVGCRIVVRQGCLLESTLLAQFGGAAVNVHCRYDDDSNCIRFSITDWVPLLAEEGISWSDGDPLLATKNTISINPRGFVNMGMSWSTPVACTQETVQKLSLMGSCVCSIVRKCC